MVAATLLDAAPAMYIAKLMRVQDARFLSLDDEKISAWNVG